MPIMKTIILKCELHNSKCPTMETRFEKLEDAINAFKETKISLKKIPHFIGLYKEYTDTADNTRKQILLEFEC